MEFPQSYGLQLRLQTPHQQYQHSALPCNFLTDDGQTVAPFDLSGTIAAGGQDRSQNLLFSPSCDVLELIPGSIPAATDAVVGGTELLFHVGVEPNSKRLRERDVYENKSQATFVDYLQLGSVSSGLCLSLGIDRAESSGDSTLLPHFLDGIEEDLRQQDLEMDRFINYEVERLRQNTLEKVHGSQLQAISLAGGGIYLQELRHSDGEIEILNRRNKELEDRVQQLTADVSAWQQRARNGESMIAVLQAHIQQAYARDDGEGCGDSSEVDERASCNLGTRPSLACRACRVSRACMVLHPCRHLCLCKDCESRLSFCPLCLSSKSKGVEVYLP